MNKNVILKNLILMGCAFLFCGALAEAFLYLMPEFQAGEPPPEVVFCKGPDHERQRSALFGETAVPNSVNFRRESEADGWYLRAYNGAGFRDLLDTGNENIVVLGDSFIEGELVNNDQTIPYLLDSWSPDLAFREFALGGWGTEREYHAYQAIENEIDHRLVILGYYVGNDLVDNIHPAMAVEDGGRELSAQADHSLLFDLHVLLRAHSRAYTFFYVNGRNLALELLGKDSIEDQYVAPADADVGIEKTRTWLLALSDAVATHGAELLIVTLPSWNELIGIEGEQRLATRQREVICDVAEARTNVHTLDLKSMVETAGFRKLYGHVDKHFSELGYYLTAKTIHEWINGTWRPTPVITPTMARHDGEAMAPDCATVSGFIKAFTAPAQPDRPMAGRLD